MFKSYNIKHTETKICSNEKTAETIPKPIFVIDHSIELPIDDDLVRDIGDTKDDSIANLLAIHQSRREIIDSITLADSKEDSCYPKGHIQYEERKYDSFHEGTSLIIYLKRTKYDVKQKHTVKDTRAVIPDKILQFNEKHYILQGCILHISDEAHYGHYIYIIYDHKGEPKEIIDDGHKFNKDSNPEPDPTDLDNTDANYNGARFEENIEQINTDGYIFLYKDLNKMQQIATEAAQLAKPFIDHAKMRVDQLRYQLYTTNANVVIAGSNGKHNLGTGLAKLQWIQHYVNDHPINVIISAQRLFVEKLDELFKELELEFPDNVSYNEEVTKDKATSTNIVVWGANSSNCYGESGDVIQGSGQAKDMVSHGPGVFGIITTPLSGEPPGIMKGFGSGAGESITSAELLQKRGAITELQAKGSGSSQVSNRGLLGRLSSIFARKKATQESPEESPVKSKPLKIDDYGVGLQPKLSKGEQITVYTQRQTILRHTLELFAKNREKYSDLAEQNLDRWSNSKAKVTPTSCILTVIEEDWGTRAQVLTQTYGTKFACLNMANSSMPGGGYTTGAAAQEENMFRRTDCHFSLTYPDIIDETYRQYTQEMKQLIEGNRKEDDKYIVYLDKEEPRICIKSKELFTIDESSKLVTINGYTELADAEIFPFYEMRSAALRITDSMLFNEEEMKRRIHAQIDTLIKKEIKHVVLGAFGCGAFRNPPERIACIYREKLKEELKRDKDCFKVIDFPIFYAGNGHNNIDIFRKAFEETTGTDKDGKSVNSWMNNTTDFKVKDNVTIDAAINYTTPVNYGGDITTVMAAEDFPLKGKSFKHLKNTDKMELKSMKERKRIYIMKETLETFAEHGRRDFEQAQNNFAEWKAKAKEKTAKVIVVNIDWGDATSKYTQQYGKIFACLNMANEAVPGGGYIKGMGAQEENMFRRTNCHFTIESKTLVNNLNPKGEWNKRLYKQDKIDLLKGEYGYVYFDWEYPRICIRGPELNDDPELGYEPYFNEDIFPFYELRCAALDRRIGDDKTPPTTGMTDDEKDTMQKRINAQLETLIVHGVKHVILGAFGCGIFHNDPKTIANMYKQAIYERSFNFEVIVFAILPDHSNPDADSNNKNYEAFRDTFTNQPITIGAASVARNASAARNARIDRKDRYESDLATALAASLATGTSISTSTSTSTKIDYSKQYAYGQNINITSAVNYSHKPEDIRMKILIDTIIKFAKKHQTYHQDAMDNLKRWEADAEAKAKEIKGNLVDVVSDDWGDAALTYTKIYGKTFACLNMASAIYPGGSYNLGGSGQEENMFRRTNCHFTVNRQEQLQEISKEKLTGIESATAYGEAYWKYNPTQINRIIGNDDVVYLDKQNPRICIKGAETISQDLGYSYLKDEDIFFFYEVRCAPLDRRTPLPPMRDMKRDTEEIKKRIKAIFKTLKDSNIKHVILGDFGCGKLKNNPFTIANIYKEVIASYAKDFEKIVITIPNAEYNTTIFDAFTKVFSDTDNAISSQGVIDDKRTALKKDRDKNEEIAEEFLMLARDRINELRNILKKRLGAKVIIASTDNTFNNIAFANGSSEKPWSAKYNDAKNQEGDIVVIGESARLYFLIQLRSLFRKLQDDKEYNGRVSFGNISTITPSLDQYVVWSAYTGNYESTPQRVIDSEAIVGGKQTKALSPHKIGLFGIIAAPGNPIVT